MKEEVDYKGKGPLVRVHPILRAGIVLAFRLSIVLGAAIQLRLALGV